MSWSWNTGFWYRSRAVQNKGQCDFIKALTSLQCSMVVRIKIFCPLLCAVHRIYLIMLLVVFKRFIFFCFWNVRYADLHPRARENYTRFCCYKISDSSEILIYVTHLVISISYFCHLCHFSGSNPKRKLKTKRTKTLKVAYRMIW